MRKARSLLSLSESIPHDKSPTGIDKEPQNSPSDHQQSCVETAFPREPQTSPSEEYVLLSSDSQLSSVGNIGAILCEPQTPTGIEYENFQYEPLDLQTTSIRLLRVLPNLSPDGLLQCSIQHATIKAEYSCLSYVWGPPDNGSPILVNGRLRRVRQNLFDFLSIARIRGTSKLFWADALCIDQDNVSERSHQVQQMGGIFSNAVEVLAWFGNCEDTADYLAYVNSPDGWIQKDAPLSRRDFHRAPYWKRAWITQEILLAQQVRLCAGHEETELTRLRSIYQWGMGSSLKAPVAVRNLIRDTRGIAKNKSLIQLVARYRYKKCHIKRDRIYSLLALCDEGSDLRVDYGASDGEVFSEALRSCPCSLCFCSVRLVASNLGVVDSSATKPFAQIPTKRPIQTDLDNGKRGLKCWRCRLVFPGALSVLPEETSLIVCLKSVCNDLPLHCIIKTVVLSGRHQPSQYHLFSRNNPSYMEDSIDIHNDPGIGLTEAAEQTGDFWLCLSLGWLLRFAETGNTLCLSIRRGVSKMRVCDHDSHDR